MSSALPLLSVYISVGGGNDTVYAASGRTEKGILYKFGNGDGNNVISGFGSADTIQLMTDTSAISISANSVVKSGTDASGNNILDLVLTVGNSNVTVKGWGSVTDGLFIADKDGEGAGSERRIRQC